MKFDLELAGGKKILIEEEQKARLDKLLENKELGSTTVLVNNINTVRLSSIKGIFPAKDPSVNKPNDGFVQAEKEWNALCESMSRLTALQKTDKEMQVRILPGWKKHGLSESDTVLSDAYGAIFDFFEENPVYPRCPATVWWPILSPKIKESPMKSLWYQYVFRNDEAIANWVKWRAT